MTGTATSLYARPKPVSATITYLLFALFLAVAGSLGVLQLGTQTASAQDATIYGVEVMEFVPGFYSPEGCTTDTTDNNQNLTASATLGPPDVVSGEPDAITNSTSLGRFGSVTIRFGAPAGGDGDPTTPDVWVWEVGGSAELYRVEVSEDNFTWVEIGLSNQQTVGSQGFDVDHAGFNEYSQIRYIRVTDVGGEGGNNCRLDGEFVITGSDIDAVGVVNRPIYADIEIEKSGVVNDGADVEEGSTVTYTFTVENTGTVDLTNVVVTDLMFEEGDITPASADILAGDTAVFTAQYEVTQADLDAGEIINEASVTGDPPEECTQCEAPEDEDEITTPLTQNPELALVKNASPLGPVREGNTITYTFEVANTGNVTITDVVIEDALEDDLTWVTGPELGDLAPGERAIGTATYVVTADDVAAGSVTNVATATGDEPENCVGECDPTSPPAQKIVPSTDDAAIVLNKESDVDYNEALVEGDTVTYTFIVKNSGIVPLTDVSVSDVLPNLSAIEPAVVAELQPEEVAIFTATYVVTEQDVQRGVIVNTATATGTPPEGPPVTAEDSEMVPPVAPQPGLNIDKVPSVTGDVAEGDVITYTFYVTNTGNIDMVGVSIVDDLPNLSDITPAFADIPLGQFATFTATYTVTADDVVNGSISNTAYADGDCRDGLCEDFNSPPDEEIVTTEPADPSLAIEKTSDVGADETVLEDDVITYTFEVTNDGNITLTNVEVNDVLEGLSDIVPVEAEAPITLAPGESVTFTATYTVTNADVLAGSIENEATATGDYGDDEEITSPPDEVIITTEGEPGLEIVKTNDIGDDETVGVGDTVTYTFVVTNTGNVPLTNVTVNDPLPGLGPISPDPVTLAPESSETFTAEYTVQQSDVDRGFIENSATGTGDYGDEDITSPPDDSTVTTDPPRPGLIIQKNAGTGSVEPAGLGDTITYTITVTNTGNVTLTDVTVNDSMPNLTWVTGPNIGTLAPNQSANASATYKVTEADILTEGDILNEATATGNPPGDGVPPVESPPDDSNVPDEDPEPGISIDKSAIPAGDVIAGETITYSFVVTNTGNVTLTDVVVTDDSLPGLSEIEPASVASLAPNSVTTFTATYTVTEADMANGSVNNTASVTGNPPGDLTPPEDEDTEEVTTVPAAPGISIDKIADDLEDVIPGQTITYSFVVTNTGNVTLTDVVVTDDSLPGLSAIEPASVASLAPDAETTFTATYVVTEADLLNGSLVNTASVTGNPPGDLTPPEDEDTETVTTVNPVPGISIDKIADDLEDVVPGQLITYSFVVTNTGNVTLTDVVVTDDSLPGLSAIEPASVASLAPTESQTFTATYIVTEADLLNGSLVNTASVTGNPPGDLTPPEDEDTETVTTVNPAPGISIDKIADDLEDVVPGQLITYSFVVTNTGNVTLTDVVVTDDSLPGLSEIEPASVASLAPTESQTFTATYIVTEADLLNGSLVNTASVTGNPPGDLTPPEDEDTETVTTVNPAPGISIDKSADAIENVVPGQTITYSFLVINTGNVTLEGVTITDAMEGLTWTNGPEMGTLAPNASVTGTATYTVTEADLLNGSLVNTASVTGNPPGDLTPPSDEDTETVTTVNPAPAIAMVKSADPASGVVLGDTITYSFTVTNTGNVALTNVTIQDDMEGLTWVNGPVFESLAPSEIVVGTATYVVTQADVNAGGVTNVATATGTPPGEEAPPSSPPSEVTVPIESASAISMVKSVSPDTTIDVGETLTYTFVVTNTGVTTVDNVTVTDPLPGISEIEGPHGTSLEPGESATFTATYVVTELDGIAGMVMNTATASGTGSDGGALSSTDSVAIRACEVPVSDDAEIETPAGTPPVENESEVVAPDTEEPVGDEPATPPTDDEIPTDDTDAPPADDAGDTPPAEDAGDTPPADDPGDTPPAGDGGDTTPADDAGDTPPAEDAGDTPPADDPGDTPPAGDDGGDTPPAADPGTEDEDAGEAQRVTVFGFQQLADCEPLPVDPAPDPDPAPQQPAPAPGVPSAPPVTSLPSTGQGAAAEGLGLATTALITAGLGIVLAAGTIVIRRNRA